MSFRGLVAPALAFRTIPTTILVTVIYVVVFAAVFATDRLPPVPKRTRGLDINEAWSDLHAITSAPHPYNSHANDAVRRHVLARIQAIHGVDIVDDLRSNGSWAGPAYGTYFEGTNLLVRVNGTDPSLNAVLFSAHYDSVSTASGATDDGMGVVTLLQLIQYFANNRGKRTAIFNINNGEEDWLNGAHAFMQHPWSNLTSTFLNLEGASSGGRPLLFRASSRTPLSSFKSQVPHPHANVLSADAFARGLIRSGTDYSVYMPNMQGLDVAFYTGRSKYHTKYDAIPHLEGGQRALWAMMETAQGAGRGLLNAPAAGDGGSVVYFELFAAAMVMFSRFALRVFDIMFLVVVPVVVLAERFVQRRAVSEWDWTWTRFWLALVLTLGVDAGLISLYAWLNPYIVYSAPYAVAFSFLMLSFITLAALLTIPIPKCGLAKAKGQTTLTQLLILSYILLLLATIFLPSVGGTYILSVWAGCTFLGWVVGAVDDFWKSRHRVLQGEDNPRRRLVTGMLHDVEDGAQRNGEEAHDEVIETEPTEITPLIQQSRQSGARAQEDSAEEEDGSMGWWIAQVLLVVPFPVILVAHVAVMLIGALAQTLSDGGGVVVVYAPIAALILLLLLPVTPFIHKIHKNVTCTFAILLVLTLLFTSGLTGSGFPFSQNDPVKIFFQQNVEILPSATSMARNSDVKIVTQLVGVPYYLDRFIVPSLPSALGSNVECKPADGVRQGLVACSWESGSGMQPSPGRNSAKLTGHGSTLSKDIPRYQNATTVPKNAWFSGEAARLSPTKVRFTVKGVNTRACRIYLDGAKARRYVVHGSGSGGMQAGYEVGEAGLQEVRLWSRTWGREFVTDVEFAEGEGKLRGRLACEWAEYESGRVGVGNSRKGDEGAKIPALEEVLKFLPKWAVVTKAADGLVEVWSSWEV